MDDKNEVVTLPAWLEALLPDTRDSIPIGYDHGSGKYTLLGVEYDSVTEPYDIANERKLNVFFDHIPGTDNSGFLFMPIDESGTGRLLVVMTDQDMYNSLVGDYEEFLGYAASYRAHRDDFKAAYDYIDNHPAFWTRPDVDTTISPWTWDTNGYAATGLDVDPFFNEDGSHGWVIEGGMHVEPGYHEHYNDYRLHVFGKTVEDAMIKFAAKVDQFYADDGTEIPDVQYEKSPFEKHVDAIINQAIDDERN